MLDNALDPYVTAKDFSLQYEEAMVQLFFANLPSIEEIYRMYPDNP